MSNFQKRTQLPTTEKIRKRGRVMQTLGYTGNRSDAPLEIYASVGAAPDPAKLPNGVMIIVDNAGNLEWHVSDGGAYKQVSI
jgi:hypothetical protein